MFESLGTVSKLDFDIKFINDVEVTEGLENLTYTWDRSFHAY